MAKPMPKLEDVAELAGFSPATVSRCLNAPDKVSAAARHKIESAIISLGYVPNAFGRALASHQTNIVGALVPSLSNAMFASGLQAFQETLAVHNLALVLATTGYDLDEEARQVRNLIAQGVSSLLLIGKRRNPKTIDLIEQRGIPYVLSWCFDRQSPQTYVGFDNVLAAQNAAEQVLRFGHHHIGLICGECKNNDRALDRRKGFEAAVTASPTQARLAHMVETDYSLESGRIAFQQLIYKAPETTAILCGNDVLAAGAIMGAREQGLRVPEDISVVGFDDIGLAKILSPALTTVRVPQLRMGQLAAEALIKMRTDQAAGTSGTSIELRTEFILRGTLAAPRA